MRMSFWNSSVWLGGCCLLFIASSYNHHCAKAFVVVPLSSPLFLRHKLHIRAPPVCLSSSSKTTPTTEEDDTPSAPVSIVGIVAPLKYIGDYACLALKFPHQKDNPSLDFVLDTGANVNTIDEEIAQEMDFPKLVLLDNQDQITSVGVGGSFEAGDLLLLGDVQLDGLPPPPTTFMTNLTAVALPHSSPVGQGLLSMYFLYSFPGGVEFDWHGTDGDPPTFVFYVTPTTPEFALEGMIRIPIQPYLPNVQLLSLPIKINNGETPIRAILDTGSPLTVMNAAAAESVGIEYFDANKDTSVKKSQEFGDEILLVGGVDGNPIPLCRSKSTAVPVQAIGDNDDDTNSVVSLGEGPIYVGNLPGLAILDSSQPTVILGLDFLKRTYRTILRLTPQEQEVWFQELAS